jgi:translation elongation factor EF-G
VELAVDQSDLKVDHWKPCERATVHNGIDAQVPLANMFGYINTLRSMSQGRAQYSMTFDHYEQVPQAVADEVRAKMA